MIESMTAKKIFVKLILWTLLVFLLIGAAYGSFFVWKITQMGNKINANQDYPVSFLDTFRSLTSNQISLKGVERQRINILLLGIAGPGKSGKNLTDTIMIASLNLKTNQVALLLIPRDLYVEVPETGIQTKINTVYQLGLLKNDDNPQKALEPLKKIIENITALNIDYWAVINFDGFQEIIDSVGGINIMNERDIYDPRYPGHNYSYTTFELKKGFQRLNGETTLKYARMRHNDPEGDFGRARRQQQVLKAAKNKVFSTGTFLNVMALSKLFDALGDNVKTDIKAEEFGDFIELVKKLDTNNINNAVIDAWDKDSLLIVSHIFYGDVRSFVLIPRIGNWNETQELAQNIFNLNEIKRRKEAISKENASVLIIDKSANAGIVQRIKNLLKDNFDYKNVAIMNDPNKNIEEKSTVYDLTGGLFPFTLDELASKLPAQASYSLSPDYKKIIANIKADLVIVIGKDLIARYNMEKDSFEEYKNSSDTNEYSEFINK